MSNRFSKIKSSDLIEQIMNEKQFISNKILCDKNQLTTKK